MMKIKLWIMLSFVLTTTVAHAQLDMGGDILDNCDDIASLTNNGDYAAARDKARLCLEGLEDQLADEVGQFFLSDVGQWEQTSLDQNQMMGINNITAVYSNDGVNVTITLLGQAGGGSGSSGLGGLLGGLAQSSLFSGGGGQQVTVAGLPATFQANGNLTVPLEDGSILTFESQSFNTIDEASDGMGDLINDFPVAEINAALL